MQCHQRCGQKSGLIRSFHSWGEGYLYSPDRFQKLLSLLLLPLSWMYCGVMYWRYRRADIWDPGVAVISIGNLTVGGSGKTPLVSALAGRYGNAAVVLRGYGRKSRGMVVVSDGKTINCDVLCSGDEAMIYAKKLPGTAVIVSEDRQEGIEQAKKMGCGVVFLDDAYSKHQILKLDLLIDVKTHSDACLPSGPYRERLWRGKDALLLHEGKDFIRHVSVRDGSEHMVLVTAIARPERLDAFLPEVEEKYYFPDHHFFSQNELEEIMAASGAASLLVTYKDYVKMDGLGLPLSLLELDLEVSEALKNKIDNFVESYK